MLGSDAPKYSVCSSRSSQHLHCDSFRLVLTTKDSSFSAIPKPGIAEICFVNVKHVFIPFIAAPHYSPERKEHLPRHLRKEEKIEAVKKTLVFEVETMEKMKVRIFAEYNE